MTTVEILFRYSGHPTETETFALANAREVYGIRRLSFDRAASTLLVEYDATRLNAATVTQLVRRSGLQLIEEVPHARAASGTVRRHPGGSAVGAARYDRPSVAESTEQQPVRCLGGLLEG